jgi:hypothetical protein
MLNIQQRFDGKLPRIVGFFLLVSVIGCIIYIGSVHRIHNIHDVGSIVSTMMLPAHDNPRCRIFNNTHLKCLPNVFIIGASKCGTTSLVAFLKALPHFHFVDRRITRSDNHSEVHRFDRKTFQYALKALDLAVEWTSSPLVTSSSDFVVHYTPHYLYAPTVPFEIRSFYPSIDDIKFIILLREPVERALSSYWFFNSKIFLSNERGSSQCVSMFA